MAASLQVKRRALEAYGALETKLAVGQPYLFGEKPSSADALLYGHLDAVRGVAGDQSACLWQCTHTVCLTGNEFAGAPPVAEREQLHAAAGLP